MKPFGVAILNRDNALLAVAHFTTRHDFPIGEGGLKEALKALYFMCVCRYIYIMYIWITVTDPKTYFTIGRWAQRGPHSAVLELVESERGREGGREGGK